MAWLPLANLLHHKLRSALSALGVAIAVGMLITLSGLARGSLAEVADRWEMIDADLIAYPRLWGDNITTLAGPGISDRYADLLKQKHPDMIQYVVPVFLWQVKLAGQDQLAVGVDPRQLHVLSGTTRLKAGRIFDPQGRFSRWIEQKLLEPPDQADETSEGPDQQLDLPADGLELVIDSRLARAGGYHVGQRVRLADHDWTIVGIVPAGGMARVYMPRRAAQFLFGCGDVTRSTLMFVKLTDLAKQADALARLQLPAVRVVPLDQYRRMLTERFSVMFMYVDTVNSVTLIVAFLFIATALYTTVLQHRRQIAILMSCGASKRFILAQVVSESAMLTCAGAAGGIAGAFVAADLIQKVKPLLTVRITPQWVLIALAACAIGAVLSALYPAWQATRVDMVESLTWE